MTGVQTCALPISSCGQVDLSYFADAAFLGDSLTVGFSDYQINLGGALICGYTGVGPDAIVNRSAVKSPTRGQEVALDVLAAAQPRKLYILLGTNTLTTLGASDRFLAYYGRLLAICMRYSGDRATAEDLLHDAFLKIYGAFDRFTYRGPGSLRAWIERITVNVALEWIRSRNRLGSVALDEGKAAAEVAEPDASEMARVPREVLMRFVSELPEGYRTVFNLYCIEEYSHREIARMLGINEKS